MVTLEPNSRGVHNQYRALGSYQELMGLCRAFKILYDLRFKTSPCILRGARIEATLPYLTVKGFESLQIVGVFLALRGSDAFRLWLWRCNSIYGSFRK